MINIAVDVMGGDYGLKVTIPAVKLFLKENKDANLILVGDENKIKQELKKISILNNNRISIYHTSEVVGMDEDPKSAIRLKKDSSLRKSIDLVKNGKASAVVSAGNTGAIIAISKFVLKTIKGISRPAIAKFLPTFIPGNMTCLLDLGANITCSPEQLYQFAILGSQLTKSVYPHKKNPKIGLINIGTEEIKGTENIKESYDLLSKSKLNFIGNIEPSQIYKGHVDVIVSDGFIGNIILKTLEGTVKFSFGMTLKYIKANIFTKLLSIFTLPIFLKLKKELHPSKFNGAIIIGLKGVVIKSHGAANARGFCFALKEAYEEAKANYISSLENEIGNYVLDIGENNIEK